MSYQAKFLFPHGSESVSGDDLRKLIQKLDVEFKSIQQGITSGSGTTVISVSGGGGGGSGGIVVTGSVFSATSVTAGTPTITFTDIGTVLYGVYGFVLKSNGDIGLAIPQIPPLTDTRGTNSVQVQVFDTGTLYLFCTK